MAAQWLLADLPIATVLNDLVVLYETDEISRLIINGHDADAFAPIRHLTIGGFREWLLDELTEGAAIAAAAPLLDDSCNEEAGSTVYSASGFGLRHARSNGNRHACGATSWWMDFGPQLPGA